MTRNPIARDLGSAKYRQRVIPARKGRGPFKRPFPEQFEEEGDRIVSKYVSPTGREITDVLEIVYTVVGISGIDDDGEPEYASEGGEVDWDSQVPHRENGQIIFIDEAGDEWTFDKLNKIGEDS